MISIRNQTEGYISQKTQNEGVVSQENSLVGELNYSLTKVFPKLENIKIEPQLEEQHLISKEYGFGEITVLKIPTENLQINPSINKQEFLGIYRQINVEAVTSEIDKNIQPENIKKGKNILGIDGSYTGIDTEDADVLPENLLIGKIAYAKGNRVIGTMPNNGPLEYSAIEQEQIIPSGYTTGGIIRAVDITSLAEYQRCQSLADMILGETGGVI